jgi:hypothetical protein
MFMLTRIREGFVQHHGELQLALIQGAGATRHAHIQAVKAS